MVAFYNQADQDIYNSGSKFVPQERYRLGYTPPVQGGGQDASTPSFGIPNTNAFTNSGGNDFNSAGNAFGYGSPVNEVNVRTFNPQELPGAEMPSELGFSNNTVPLGNNNISVSQLGIAIPGGQVSNTYNRARNAMQARGDDAMSRDYPDFTAAEVARLSNNSIQDYRQNYGAQGQYNSPYEDSMDLGYQGTLGNKGMLNRFKNKVGDVARFAGALLPFPLNVATKFLPKGDDNGPGGGTYGIAGLSDDKKAAYNALAGGNMLFGGEQGFKTLTGKNFQATNYVPNQLEMYEKLKDEEELTGFQKKQLQEASAVYKATQKQNKAAQDAAAQAAVRETNFASQGKSDPNDQSRAGSSGRRPGSGGNVTATAANTNKETGTTYDSGGREGFGYGLKEGGRAGYFFGGRVNFKDGGLASIL